MLKGQYGFLVAFCKGICHSYIYILNPYAALLVAIYQNIIYFYLQVL